MRRLLIPLLVLLTACTTAPKVPYGQTVKMDDATLMDKIRGGWYGQTIGCTYGGPTEFKYKGGIIMEEIPIPWYDNYIYDTYIEDPGLYDDVYMDLTFLETMLQYGIDAPADKYAEAFANADYKLWHANQAARYNILNGHGAPDSGHWKNNPHADDIDFQIEADFIGMLYPGQANKASGLSDRIGHIMNYGDGWYGGVYIGAMYCLAYVCDDIPTIVTEALKTIPEGTKFHSTISDVIKYWKQYPDDWKQCWFEVTNRHANDVGCPEGVWNGFNIDATINSAFVVIGLLYGGGDFFKTIDISTRCGNDSDCNPASAAGILGVMYGYSAIPDKWKRGAERIKEIPFPYTSLSLEAVCRENFDLVKKLASKSDNMGEYCIYIEVEKPQAVRYEQSFEGIKPVEKRVLKKAFTDSVDLQFTGNSIVVEGSVRKTGHADDSYVANITALLDGTEVENFNMPVDYITRKYEIFSKYCFPSGGHTLTLRLNNPHPDYELYASEMVVYDEE
ncbi:MAG: ADP-ribosylglycohydrolase family protein [Bacteroidales bacterium]|nr:ADP-ribosylglycohydrolase family protein [Bacteroidales bacterium]